jgi:hypothetical protein
MNAFQRRCQRSVTPATCRIRTQRVIVSRRSAQSEAAERSDAGENISTGVERANAKVYKLKLWMLCIKPPMYSVCIAPMVLGAALAYVVSGTFPASACGDLTLGGIFFIAWLNLRFVVSETLATSARVHDRAQNQAGLYGDGHSSVQQ